MRSLLLIISLIGEVIGGWIDLDTSKKDYTTRSFFSKEKYDLVFSDEFEINNRNFADGHDPKWTSIDKNDYTNDALQYYRDRLVRTSNGSLVISTVLEDINFHAFSSKPNEANKLTKLTKNYQSGMIQGWNKFCFTGGIVEVSAKLPGNAYIGGLWPAMWLLGNLARATYVRSSDNMWPWSFDECSRDIQKQQEISKCNTINHFALHKYQGRGAPEIDILEAMPGKEKLENTPVNRPYFSASLQISPATEEDRPVPGHDPLKTTKNWYHEGLEYGDNSSVNIYFYGTVLKNEFDKSKNYQTDAISANREVSPTHFNEFHKYRVEWKSGPNGYIRWYLDSHLIFALNSDTLKLNKALIPEEPMYLIFNTAVSKTWGFPQPCPVGCKCNCFDCRKPECRCAVPPNMCHNFPAHFEIDYVRVYQTKSDPNQLVGCSTPSHPTSRFIKGRAERYMQEGDTQPLKPISHGGAKCLNSNDCGREGVCQSNKCKCLGNYTGPTCKASLGFNDINYEEEEDLSHLITHIPSLFVPLSLQLISITLFLSGVSLVIHLRNTRNHRLTNPIPTRRP